MITLKVGSALQAGKYEILKVLGQGGFGITYLARHTLLGTLFAIKEFFPQDYCDRDDTTSHITVNTRNNSELIDKLRSRFLAEAQNLAKLKHPGILQIHDVFEENATAYYVMDFIEGETLDALVERLGPLPENQAVNYIIKVAETLDFIHQRKMMHFDIKPANIMLRASDGLPVLIDFGLSKQFNDQGHANSTLLLGVSHGFSAIEQYFQTGIAGFSPQTDVYALGATLYYLLTSRIPPEAPRLSGSEIEVPLNISPRVASAVKKAMESNINKRCQSASDFIKSLSSDSFNRLPPNPVRIDVESDIDSEPVELPVYPENESKGKSTAMIVVGVAISAIIAVGIIWWIFGKSNGKSTADDVEIESSYLSDDDQSAPSLPRRSQAEEGAGSEESSQEEMLVSEKKEEASEDARIEESRPELKNQLSPSSDPSKDAQDIAKEVRKNIEVDETPKPSDNEIHTAVDQQAQFPGGQSALFKFIGSNVKYPPLAQENNIQGRVLVKFVVEKDGSISNVSVIKGVDNSLDKEAIRVVKAMPKWTPAKLNGNIVRSYYTIPITFKLQN